MKNWIIITLLSFNVYSQSIESLNEKFEIANKIERFFEARIYIYEALSREVKLYRIYKDSIWNMEKYNSNYAEYIEENIIEYYPESEIKNEEFELEIFKVKYNFPVKKKTNLEKYWTKLNETNILNVPNFENKFFVKEVRKIIDGKEVLHKIPIPPCTDGYHYIIEFKNDRKSNKTEINNPKYYYSRIPENKNLKSIFEFITIFEEVFSTKTKHNTAYKK